MQRSLTPELCRCLKFSSAHDITWGKNCLNKLNTASGCREDALWCRKHMQTVRPATRTPMSRPSMKEWDHKHSIPSLRQRIGWGPMSEVQISHDWDPQDFWGNPQVLPRRRFDSAHRKKNNLQAQGTQCGTGTPCEFQFWFWVCPAGDARLGVKPRGNSPQYQRPVRVLSFP